MKNSIRLLYLEIIPKLRDLCPDDIALGIAIANILFS